MFKMSDVHVDSSKFERAHAKSPRGFGQWGFCPRSHYDQSDYLAHVFWVSGSFAAAKRVAREHFAKMNVADVVVCS
jgi:hypothetical protein